MKKIIALGIFSLALFLFSNSNSYSQTLYFCEGVDNDGYPISAASTFNINSSGGYLYVLARLPYQAECSSMKLVIYRNGDYDNTIYIDTEYDWTWFWKKVTFYKSGNYDIYLYDCYDLSLASKSLRINVN